MKGWKTINIIQRVRDRSLTSCLTVVHHQLKYRGKRGKFVAPVAPVRSSLGSHHSSTRLLFFHRVLFLPRLPHTREHEGRKVDSRLIWSPDTKDLKSGFDCGSMVDPFYRNGAGSCQFSVEMMSCRSS